MDYPVPSILEFGPEMVPPGQHNALPNSACLEIASRLLLILSNNETRPIYTPTPQLNGELLDDSDKLKMDFLQYATEEIEIADNRFVWFDQLPWIYDAETEDYFQQPIRNGFRLAVGDRITDTTNTDAQYIFTFDNFLPLQGTIYFGWNTFPENALTDLDHVKGLTAFLFKLEQVALAEGLEVLSKSPNIIET